MENNIFDKRFMEVLNDARKHRLAAAPVGPDSISISRASFDDLISIVQVATRVNVPDTALQSIHITRADGQFHCVAECPGLVKATGSGRTLLEALSVVLREFGAQLNARCE